MLLAVRSGLFGHDKIGITGNIHSLPSCPRKISYGKYMTRQVFRLIPGFDSPSHEAVSLTVDYYSQAVGHTTRS